MMREISAQVESLNERHVNKLCNMRANISNTKRPITSMHFRRKYSKMKNHEWSLKFETMNFQRSADHVQHVLRDLPVQVRSHGQAPGEAQGLPLQAALQLQNELRVARRREDHLEKQGEREHDTF